MCPQCGRQFRTTEAARLHIRLYHVRRPAPTPKEDGMERIKK